MEIDIERLREDIKQDYYGAFFVGGFGAALFESFDVDKATPKELIDIARKRGVDLRDYQI